MGRLTPLALIAAAFAFPAAAQESALLISGVSTGGAIQSYLRFSNSDGVAHAVSVMLHRPITGEMLTMWSSPSIPAGGTYEVPIAAVLAGGDPPLPAGALPTNLVVAISGLVGHVQHATWTASGSAWNNVTACGMAFMADPLSLPYVSGPARSTLAGFVRITNATPTPRSMRLTFSDNSGAHYIWESPVVPTMGAATVSMTEIGRQATPPIPETVNAMTATADSAPFGFALSYLEGAAGGDTFDDFSAGCMLAIPAPANHDATSPAPSPGGHGGMTMQ